MRKTQQYWLTIAIALSATLSVGFAQGTKKPPKKVPPPPPKKEVKYVRVENRLNGLSLEVPESHQPVPVPPDEKSLILKFCNTDLKNFSQLGDLWILSVEKLEEVKQLLANKLPGWTITPGKSDGFEEGKFYTLRKQNTPQTVPTFPTLQNGCVFVIEKETRVLCLIGFYTMQIRPIALQKLQSNDCPATFERCAKSLREVEAIRSAGGFIEYYKTHPFRNPEYRINVRENLAKGWKAEDTENFIIIYDANDSNLVGKIKTDLEIMRKKYVELFPSEMPIEAVSTVRLCKDIKEFYQFSGAPVGVVGFFNPLTQELVFFDAVPQGGTKKDDISHRILYHEAFHQYIYHCNGKISPHRWFDEGYGDYFSGFFLGNGFTRVEFAPGRLSVVQEALRVNKFVPLKRLVSMNKLEFYTYAKITYPQAWSFVYFLLTSKEVQENPAWNKILKNYFEAFRAKSKELSPQLVPELTMEAFFKLEAEAQNAANKECFRDINFEELEKAWADYTSKLEIKK